MGYYAGDTLIITRTPTTVVVGVDPSSRKLAAIIGGVQADVSAVTYEIKALPQDKPHACLIAYQWAEALVTDQPGREVYVAVELPVFGRGGPGSTIPQAQINGALLAGVTAAGGEVLLVNNARAKKQIVGKGNASKEEIRQWVEREWPGLFTVIGEDQDLCDATMIWQYGVAAVTLRNRIARRKSLGGTSIKRRKQ